MPKITFLTAASQQPTIRSWKSGFECFFFFKSPSPPLGEDQLPLRRLVTCTSVQLTQTSCLLDVRRFSWAPSTWAPIPQVPNGWMRPRVALWSRAPHHSCSAGWMASGPSHHPEAISKSPETLDSCYSSSLPLSVLLDVDIDPSSS